MEYISSEIA